MITREEVKELLPIMQAFAEGKTIQYRHKGRVEWYDLDSGQFNCDMYYYRIKPEPKYRPFKTKEECWTEMLKHQPFGWIYNKFNDYLNIYIVYNSNVDYGVRVSGHPSSLNYEHMFKDYKFADGTPFGIKEE